MEYPCFQVFQALDTPQVADKVFSLVALYRSPLFLWEVGYSIHRDTSFFRNSKGRTFSGPPSHLCLRKAVNRLTKFDKNLCYVKLSYLFSQPSFDPHRQKNSIKVFAYLGNHPSLVFFSITSFAEKHIKLF